MSIWRRILTPSILTKVLKRDIPRSLNYYVSNNNITSKVPNLGTINYNSIRWKSKKKQHDSEDQEETFNDADDSSLSKDSKVIKFNCTSMRIDAILKSALAISRNKIEQMFYESKIRINGKKILKKSSSARIGDEIDVIKMVSPNNSGHLYVARVEILNVEPKDENIAITVRRFKNLLIENYEDPHKTVPTESDG